MLTSCMFLLIPMAIKERMQGIKDCADFWDCEGERGNDDGGALDLVNVNYYLYKERWVLEFLLFL